MASVYNRGLQDAETFFDLFVDGNIVVGKSASGTGSVVLTTIDFTPDFVLFDVPANANAKSWTATSTTLTLVGRSATTAAVVSYIAGNLA